MNIASLPRVPGALKRKKRVGRGIGSGHGKTSTRGQKGQRARTGSRKHPGFEGGQNPLIRRLPKRGFRVKTSGHNTLREIVNLNQLDEFADGQRVGPKEFESAGPIRDAASRVKLLGEGELKKKLVIHVHQASGSAQAKVLKAGGSIERLTSPTAP